MRSDSFKDLAKGARFAVWAIVVFVAYSLAGAAFTTLSTVNTGSGLKSTDWNAMVADLGDLNTRVGALSNVPTGAVMAFNLTACPSGWTEADGSGGRPNLRWEFVRWWNRNATGADGGRAFGTWQNGTAFMGDGDGNNMPVPNLGDATQRSTLGVEPDSTPATWPLTFKYSNPDAGGGTCTVNGSTTTGDASTCASYARTRPRNVALLYCVKD